MHASAPVKEQIVALARTQRQNSWEWRRFDNPERRLKASLAHSRVLPIFEALAAVEPEDAQVHAEFGYALKDDQSSDERRAFEELSDAIALATRAGTATDWMHMNRAIVGIRLGLRDDEINRDLQDANSGTARVRQVVSVHSEIQDWLAAKK